jgi:hypothetical protein
MIVGMNVGVDAGMTEGLLETWEPHEQRKSGWRSPVAGIGGP